MITLAPVCVGLVAPVVDVAGARIVSVLPRGPAWTNYLRVCEPLFKGAGVKVALLREIGENPRRSERWRCVDEERHGAHIAAVFERVAQPDEYDVLNGVLEHQLAC